MPCLMDSSLQANIHSFLESDDRVAVVMKYMEDAIAELDTMDGLISTYKIHLNVCFIFQALLTRLTFSAGSWGRHFVHPIPKPWSSSANTESEGTFVGITELIGIPSISIWVA